MFGLFKKKSRTEQLLKKYRTLLSEAHTLSTRNRRQSDSKYAEADELLREIKALEKS